MKRYHYLFLIITFVVSVIIVYNFQLLNFGEYEMKNNEKYIQFQCTDEDICGGWADRLKGLLSTYAFSLITNRTFLIKMTKNCNLKNVLEPNVINWDHSTIKVKKIKLSKIVNFGWNFDLYKKFKTEKFLLKDLENYTLVSLKAAFMFSDAISENPYFKKTIQLLGYKQHEFQLPYLLRNWYKKLFKLNKRLQLKHDKFLKKMKPSKDTKLICAQVRMGDHGHAGETDKNSPMLYWNFINKTFINSSEKYSIFVTSDRNHVKFEAKKFFSPINVVFNINSSLHIEKKMNGLNGCFELEMVILDFHLMQYCDAAVVGHSGFGIMAMWNRPDPFKDVYVYTNPDLVNFRKNYWNRKNLTFVKYHNISSIYFKKVIKI